MAPGSGVLTCRSLLSLSFLVCSVSMLMKLQPIMVPREISGHVPMYVAG